MRRERGLHWTGSATSTAPDATGGVEQRSVLQMRNIHVNYGSVHALRGVDFDLYEGEVHALVGEHRAGKSSLVKLLSGAIQKSGGEIIYRGREIKSFSLKSAIEAGIAMVYQEINILPSLNAVENIFAGKMIRKRLWGLDRFSMVSIAKELFNRLNFDVDMDLPLYRLTQGEQLRVEFARILLLDPKVIILDELSNKLTPEEMGTIYDILVDYRRQGKGIIYITHDIEEILKLADRVTILKDGYRRGTERVADLDQYRLFQLTYSYQMGKREIDSNRMRFYLLKRYSEAFIRHLPIGIVILDAADVVQLANFGGIERLELPREREGGRSLRELLAALKIPVVDEIADRLARREESSWDDVRLGDDKLVKIDLFPLRDDVDAVIGTAIIVQDVSIDRSLKDYIIRAEKMATMAEVAAGVAHEINNPLFIIRNYVELLKAKELDADGSEKLAKIEKELARIVEIIGSLLSFSRFKELTARRTNLAAVIDEALLLLQHNITTKKIRVERRLPSEPVDIIGDENRLKQLFLNLLINGIDAVLDGGLIRIGLEVHAAERVVEVRIADNGYGIPIDIQSKIFNPFFTTKMTKKNTGLGLSICQQIAEAHNGIITFTSAPGELTEFTVRLPVG